MVSLAPVGQEEGTGDRGQGTGEEEGTRDKGQGTRGEEN